MATEILGTASGLATAAEQLEQERIAIAAEVLGYDQVTHLTPALIAQKLVFLRSQVDFFRAFGDETRMDLIVALMFGGTPDGQLNRYTVSDIAERFRLLQDKDISLSTISHHLQELKRLNIVKVERHGKERYYQIDLDYMIEHVGNWYRRLLAKRELLKQGKAWCPADVLAMFNVLNEERKNKEVDPES